MAKHKIAGRVVPRGVIEDRGYVFVRLWVEGRLFKRCIGPVSPEVVADAIAKVGEYRQQIRLGKFDLESRADRITVSKACDIYWRLHGSLKKTSESFERNLRYIKAAMGGRWLDSITYLDIEAYRREREKVVSPSSVNREHTVLTHLFNALKKWRRLKVIANVRLPEENPAALVKRVDEKPYRRKRVLSPEEFDRFLKSAPIQVRRNCLAAVLTGLRRKDLKNLTVGNVNFATNQLEGVQAKTGRPFAVPIVGEMLGIIETAKGSRILDFRNFRKQFEAARKRAGLEFQFRDLRRTAGRMLLQKGIDLATVSSYLGHTTISMTEAYVQSAREHKQMAGEILGTLYRAPGERVGHKLSEKLSQGDILVDHLDTVKTV